MMIYLIRHLPTTYNRSGVYMGRSQDLPILQEMAPAFREMLASHVVKKGSSSLVVCSPALRCIQTADLLHDQLMVPTPVEVNKALNEVDYGAFEGKAPQQIKLDFPNEYLKWMLHPSQVRFPNGESFLEVQNRAVAFLHYILSNKGVDSVFLVTHVDVIKMLVCWVLDIPIDSKRMFRIDNGSVTRLETAGEKYNRRGIKVRYLNYT